MIQKPILFTALLFAGCSAASASVLIVSASGQFSGSDTAGPLVAPNGTFSLGFDVDSSTTPVAGTVSTLGFDAPIFGAFSYKLNGTAVAVAPREITFSTLADGGLFTITFGTGLSADQFSFQGGQAFSGTTASPAFAAGSYSVASATYSDPANYDFPSNAVVTVAAAPEPSAILLISGGLAALMARKFRTYSPKK